MKTIGFFISCSSNENINFDKWLDCNPGFGGTFYISFSLLLGLLNLKSYKIVLYSSKPYKLINERLIQREGSNIHDAVDDFDKNFGGIFIVTPRRDKDLSDINVLNTKIITWGHCLYEKRTVKDITLNPCVSANIFLTYGHAALYKRSKIINKSLIIGNFTQNSDLSVHRTINYHNNVCYIGALYGYKHFDYLLSVWNDIYRKNKKSKLYVIGSSSLHQIQKNNSSNIIDDSSYRKEIDYYLNRLDDKKSVIFMGLLNSNEIFNFLSKNVAVGVVNPVGSTETFCTSAIEFGSVGVPVVGSSYGGHLDTIPNDCGFRIKTKSQLKKKINILLNDNILNYKLGSKYSCFVKNNYSFEIFLGKWIKVIESIYKNGNLSFISKKSLKHFRSKSSFKRFFYRINHKLFKKIIIKC